VAREIDDDIKVFSDDRRTLIEQAERVVLTNLIVDEPVTVVVSSKYWARTRLGHGLDLSSAGFKEGDCLLTSFECRSTDQCIVFCNNGRVCSIAVSQLPGGRGDGVPLSTLIDVAPGAKIVHVICGGVTQNVLIATAASYGFICKINDMVVRNKAGKQFITIEEGESILAPVLFSPSEQSWVISASRSGRLLAFSLLEMKYLASGGRGLIVMGLDEGDVLASLIVTRKTKLLIRTQMPSGREQLLKLSESDLQSHFGKRARMGRMLPLKAKFFVSKMVLESSGVTI
jgi:topoisomerase-4 subunit A